MKNYIKIQVDSGLKQLDDGQRIPNEDVENRIKKHQHLAASN
ncbi:MAG: hypothetical protein PVH88_25385 [Ignavibacteria bacterium]